MILRCQNIFWETKIFFPLEIPKHLGMPSEKQAQETFEMRLTIVTLIIELWKQ